MSFPTRKAPDHITALFTQANALAARAQYREALKSYDKILAKVPGHLDVINNRANCFSALGQYEHAITSYGTILAARPNVGNWRRTSHLSNDELLYQPSQ